MRDGGANAGSFCFGTLGGKVLVGDELVVERRVCRCACGRI
jgi:hypothetical protein